MKIGYARASRYDHEGIDAQTARLTEAGCTKVFSEEVDKAASPRRQLDACLSTLKRRDTLMVCSLERLGRSMEDIIRLLLKLRERGVAFCSIDDDINMHGAKGRIMAGVLQSLAQFKTDIVRTRRAEAVDKGVKRGKQKGCINKVNREKPATCKQLYENGTPVGKIMKLLNIRSYSTVHRYLEMTGARRLTYLGPSLFDPITSASPSTILSKKDLQQYKKEVYDKSHQLNLFDNEGK